MIFGVDLRASPTRPTSVAVLDHDGRLCSLASMSQDEEIAGIGKKGQSSLIAIGSPLSLPKGLCCLEATCPCETDMPQSKGRQAEMELSRMKISCFFTNKRSIMRTLIYRGIRVADQLRSRGHKVIEVYPHASKVVLFGDKIPPKKSPKSLPFMKDQLSPMVDGLDPHLKTLDANRCNAILNAYTGLLHHREETDSLGTEDEGWVVLPCLPR